MWWAFWRRSRRDPLDGPAPEESPQTAGHGGPEVVPLGGPGHGVPGVDPEASDDARGHARSSPFSGATPDAAAAWLATGGGTALPAEVPLDPDAEHPDATPLAPLDAAEREGTRRAVVDVVRAALVEDAGSFQTALTLAEGSAASQVFATSTAAAALAARLPALSGVADPVHLDVQDDALLHAYAALLAERAEPVRVRVAPDVPREAVLRLAHLCAGGTPRQQAVRSGKAPPADDGRWPGAALGGSVSDHLRAACVLLAQTCRDGAPGPEALADELQEAAR